MMARYIALVHKESGSDYGVSFPDFPGCVSAGETLEEARAAAEEALSLHIEGMIEDGEMLPEPSSLDAVMSSPENRDGVAILVSTPQQNARSIRVNVTLPEDVLREIDAFARGAGYTRSGFLALAARHEIERGTKRK